MPKKIIEPIDDTFENVVDCCIKSSGNFPIVKGEKKKNKERTIEPINDSLENVADALLKERE